jgi:hypothetical protein
MAARQAAANLIFSRGTPIRAALFSLCSNLCDPGENSNMPYILLWLLGIPLPIILIIALLWH